MKWSKHTLFALLLAIGMLFSIQSGLSAFTTWFSPFGNQYLPAVVYGHTNLNDECGNYGAFFRGAHSWNQVSCTSFQFVAGGIVNRITPVNDDFQVVRWVNTCDPGVLATTYLVSNGPDRECDMQMCRNWNWNCGPGSTPYSQIDLQSVVAHELGHVLGLGHSSNAAATMYYALSFGNDSKRTLHQDDINGICYLYD